MIKLLGEDEKPSWVIYPSAYLDLVKNGEDEFLPWYLMDKDQLLIRYNGMQMRYPDKTLFPFARDDNSDDVACWEEGKPNKVILIHDFASPGFENKKEFESFEEWYKYVTTYY